MPINDQEKASAIGYAMILGTPRKVGSVTASNSTPSRRQVGVGGGGKKAEENPPCSLCGGPHPYDTSIPSVLWNRVIRGRGLPDYLCMTCIVKAFAETGESFTANLTCGAPGTMVEVVINGAASNGADLLEAENTELRMALWSIQDQTQKTLNKITKPVDPLIPSEATQ
jgi:hypothetical protein